METVIALAMRNAQRILEALLPDGDRTARYVDVALGAARAADRALRLQVPPERNG
jgi:hypothetical protein